MNKGFDWTQIVADTFNSKNCSTLRSAVGLDARLQRNYGHRGPMINYTINNPGDVSTVNCISYPPQQIIPNLNSNLKTPNILFHTVLRSENQEQLS